MPIEVQILGYAGLLQCVQFGLIAIAVNQQHGIRYTAGSRDQVREMTGVPGRLLRAFNNHFEALVLFTIAVIVVTLGEASSEWTERCAWVYLIARMLYIPAYASGLPWIRSFFWLLGFGATLALLLLALWP